MFVHLPLGKICHEYLFDQCNLQLAGPEFLVFLDEYRYLARHLEKSLTLAWFHNRDKLYLKSHLNKKCFHFLIAQNFTEANQLIEGMFGNMYIFYNFGNFRPTKYHKINSIHNLGSCGNSNATSEMFRTYYYGPFQLVSYIQILLVVMVI